MSIIKKILYSIVLFAGIVPVAHAAAPATLANNGTANVNMLVGTAATGTSFLTFVSSGTTTANATDLANVTYDGVHPTAGTVSSSSLLTFVFPISIGTDKSGGTFDIAANTYVDLGSTPNSLINVADSSITDSANPIITAASVASDNSDTSLAKVGDTVTVSFTTTEDLDTGVTQVNLYSGGDPINGDVTLTNVSGNDWEASYVTDTADTEGLVTFELLPADIDGNQDSTYVTDVTDASSVTFDKTAPVISEITPVTASDTDTTPEYTFTTDDAGTISYGGDCTSSTASATSGSNTITFSTLATGTHSNCTIIVADAAGNASNTLAVTSFEITAPAHASSSIGGGYTHNLADIPTPTVVLAPDAVVPQTKTCEPLLSAHLMRGDKNDAVSKLQTFLQAQHLFDYPTITGFFGSITLQSVKDFQKLYAQDILAPIGLTLPTGFVGDMTIKKINALNCQ